MNIALIVTSCAFLATSSDFDNFKPMKIEGETILIFEFWPSEQLLRVSAGEEKGNETLLQILEISNQKIIRHHLIEANDALKTVNTNIPFPFKWESDSKKCLDRIRKFESPASGMILFSKSKKCKFLIKVIQTGEEKHL